MSAPDRPVRPIVDYLLALADATRLRILLTLRAGERSVGAVAAEARASRDRVSRQLVHLRSAGLVACRRERGRVVYRIAAPDVFAICDAVCSSLEAGRDEPISGSRFAGTRSGPVEQPL